MTENRDCGADVAPYALGALEEPEADAFRRHMATCAVCHDELAAYQQVADSLALAARQYPVPRGLRRRTVRRIRAEQRAEASSRPDRARGAARRRALAIGLAGAVAILAVELGRLPASSPSTRVIRASVVGGAGSAELRISGRQAQLIVAHLPPPGAGHIYEVWLIRGTEPPAPTAALFSVNAAGDGDVTVPGDLRGVSAVLVTPEPDGGSLRPTHAPVITARL